MSEIWSSGDDDEVSIFGAASMSEQRESEERREQKGIKTRISARSIARFSILIPYFQLFSAFFVTHLAHGERSVFSSILDFTNT